MVLEATFLKKEFSNRSQQAALNAHVTTKNGSSSSSSSSSVRDFAASWSNENESSSGPQHRQDKINAIIAVKDLLHRKEQLVAALTKMNARVGSEQERRTTSNSHSSSTAHASSSGVSSSWPTVGDRSILQRQYAWVVVNLDITNRHLQEALVRLQECSGTSQVGFQFVVHLVIALPVWTSHSDLSLYSPRCLRVSAATMALHYPLQRCTPAATAMVMETIR